MNPTTLTQKLRKEPRVPYIEEVFMVEIISLFADMVKLAFPYAFVFAFGGKLVNSFLGMAFDGHFKL